MRTFSKMVFTMMVALTMVFSVVNVTIAEESNTHTMNSMPQMPTAQDDTIIVVTEEASMAGSSEESEEALNNVEEEALNNVEEEAEEIIIEDEETPLGTALALGTHTTGSVAQDQIFNGSVAIQVLGESFRYGDIVTLQAMLMNCEGFACTLQWEYSVNGEDWFAAPGFATGEAYQYKLDTENATWNWRVALEVA